MRGNIFIVGVFLFMAVTGIQSQIIIKGTLPEKYNNRYVYIAPLDIHTSLFESPVFTDSTMVVNGKFAINTNLPVDTSLYVISLDRAAGSFIAMDKTELIADYTENELQDYFKISGSPLNEQLTEFAEHPIKMSQRALGIMNERQELLSKNEWTLEKENDFNEMAKNEATLYRNIVSNIIKDNIENNAGKYIYVMAGAIVNEETMEEIEPKLDASTKQLMEERTRMTMKMIEDSQAPHSIPEAVQPSNKYIDVTGETLSGEKITLSSIIDSKKVVLIDFWASWCGPCLREMPILKELYEKYKDKGLEIVGISLDTNKTAWKNMVNNKEMNWPQLIDSDMANPIKDIYGVRAIPHTVLINEEGIIIENQLQGNELKRRIEELLQ